MTDAHPANREMLPDDPLQLSAVEVPGDVELMFRLLVEEYARMGHDTDAIMRLARNPFYTGFHRFFVVCGEDELRSRIQNVLRRCGVVRVSNEGGARGGRDEERNAQCRT